MRFFPEIFSDFLRRKRKINKTIDALVKCPFYLREKDRTVDCEGLIDGTDSVTKFSSRGSKNLFMKEHCVRCMGVGCKLAEALCRKYE